MSDVFYGDLEINDVISPNDGMFEGDADAYFAVGRTAADAILGILEQHGPKHIGKILDFGCGHGRVLRYLSGVFPTAAITAADMLHDGVDFCAQTLGAEALYVDREIGRVMTDDRFDLVWAGSVVTHLDRHEILSLLDYLASVLTFAGLLIFSNHGHLAYQWLKNEEFEYGLEEHARIRCLERFEQTGFAYSHYPGMGDYGLSFADETNVREMAEEVRLEVLDYLPRGWGHGHHDLVVCRPGPGRRSR